MGRDVSRATQDYRDPVWYSCMPKEYDTELCPLLTFSPGICPYAWKALSTSVDGNVTVATCCMRGFTIDTKFGDCSKNTKDFVVTRRANPNETMATTTVGVISSDGNTVYGIADGQTVSQVISDEESEFPHEGTTYESLTVVISKPYSFDDGENVTMAAGQLSHTAWVVMWQSSDGIHTDATTRPTPDTDGTHNGLSGGAIAGVVIGVLAAFVLGVMIGLLIRRRRQRPLVPSGTREQPMAVSEVNSGQGFVSEQRPNGTTPPDMAYATEEGAVAGPSHQQPRPWLAFVGSHSKGNAH
ncbi:hypothetical protein FALCPG4_017330 [Fusarium falciforme]